MYYVALVSRTYTCDFLHSRQSAIGHELDHSFSLGVLHTRLATFKYPVIFVWPIGDDKKSCVEFLLVSLFNFRSMQLANPQCLTDRLENEHLGNMDQYRITREVPLPYSFDIPQHDDDDDEDKA